MLSQNLLLKCFSCFITIHFLQTCYGKQIPHCGPSSCGNIPNISHPFRLKDDPKHCGDPKYELACENNTSSIDFNSHKYLVQEINYPNNIIRLTDADIKNESCSFPKYSLSRFNFTDYHPYSIKSHMGPRYMRLRPDTTRSIAFMSCPYQVNNSPLLEAVHCVHKNYGFNESNRRRTYIKFGELNGSYIMDMCTIELMVMTSLPLKDEKNVTISEIHSSLLYGFELSWSIVRCDGGILGDISCGMPYWAVKAFNCKNSVSLLSGSYKSSFMHIDLSKELVKMLPLFDFSEEYEGKA
ncbi:hypothetical protein Pfo_010250 [Paulownia fortunei]|nr:hypothetical protein Pfo_010250 [Paulownia fortunei]